MKKRHAHDTRWQNSPQSKHEGMAAKHPKSDSTNRKTMISQHAFYLALARKLISPEIQRCIYPETFRQTDVGMKLIELTPCLFDSDADLANAKFHIEDAKDKCIDKANHLRIEKAIEAVNHCVKVAEDELQAITERNKIRLKVRRGKTSPQEKPTAPTCRPETSTHPRSLAIVKGVT